MIPNRGICKQAERSQARASGPLMPPGPWTQTQTRAHLAAHQEDEEGDGGPQHLLLKLDLRQSGQTETGSYLHAQASRHRPCSDASLCSQRSKPWTVHTRRRMSMCVLRAFCVHVCAQSYPTLCDPTDVARQAHLAMDFPRQEYWSGRPFPPPGDLPDPGIKPPSPVLQAHSSPRSHLGSLSVCKAQMQTPACTSSHLIFTQCNVILTVLQEN